MPKTKKIKNVSFANVVEYQKQYFKELYNVTDFAAGYYTTSPDKEYFNANSIIGIDESTEIIEEICTLLALGVETTKIQVPVGVLNFADEQDEISLFSYENQKIKITEDIDICLVTEKNYLDYVKLSQELQVQEYGSEYKRYANETYLNQNKYQLYMINYQGIHIGEFTYIPKLQAVESIIILSQYQRNGIMTKCFEIITSKLSSKIYMSSDKSSVGFYKKLNCQHIDCVEVNYLYGQSRNLLTYLIYSI